ncbi:hypothetical protein B7954_15975, partial [Vibrio cholerae]
LACYVSYRETDAGFGFSASFCINIYYIKAILRHFFSAQNFKIVEGKCMEILSDFGQKFLCSLTFFPD